MGTESKRSATDILLDIEARLGTLEKRQQNSENLLKILLARLNAALNGTAQPAQVQPQVQPQVQQQPPQPVRTPQPVTGVVNKDNFDTRPKTSRFSEAAANHGLDVEEDIEVVDPFESQHIDDEIVARPIPPVVKQADHDTLIEAPSRGNSRGQRGPKTKSTKCSVSQDLSRDDSPVFLANVELLDENGTLVNQTRTNTKGRWMMALAPGSYQVHVLKRFPPDSGKKPIDVTYPIVIPPSDKPLELSPLSLSADG